MRYVIYEKYSGRSVHETDSFEDARNFIRYYSKKVCGKFALYDSVLNTFDPHKIKNIKKIKQHIIYVFME